MRQSQKKSPTRKTRAEINEESRERKRLKKHRGHSAGSRHSGAKNNKNSGQRSEKDPRIGSKKLIPLIIDKPVTEKKVEIKEQKATLPFDKELELLENDDRLTELLDKIDNGESLTAKEQSYVDYTLDRIDELMVLLDIEDEDDESEQSDNIMNLLKNH